MNTSWNDSRSVKLRHKLRFCTEIFVWEWLSAWLLSLQSHQHAGWGVAQCADWIQRLRAPALPLIPPPSFNLVSVLPLSWAIKPHIKKIHTSDLSFSSFSAFHSTFGFFFCLLPARPQTLNSYSDWIHTSWHHRQLIAMPQSHYGGILWRIVPICQRDLFFIWLFFFLVRLAALVDSQLASFPRIVENPVTQAPWKDDGPPLFNYSRGPPPVNMGGNPLVLACKIALVSSSPGTLRVQCEGGFQHFPVN